jgi:hypothetical protein
MERYGDTLVFTVAEQTQYHIADTVSSEAALVAAARLLETGEQILARLTDNQAQPDICISEAASNDRRALRDRALSYVDFSELISQALSVKMIST